MVVIEIPDGVWELYKRGWALFGVKGHRDVVDMMIFEMKDMSEAFIKEAKIKLISNAPEALMLRETGLREEARKMGLDETMETGELMKKLENTCGRLFPLDNYFR